jgi:hypothetical protein
VEGSSPSHRIRGDNIVPGDTEDQVSYRSELSGLYGITMVIHALCEFNKIDQGTMEVGYDSITALERGFDGTQNPSSAAQHFDLIVVELLRRGAGIDANNDSKGATSILGNRKSRGVEMKAKDHRGNTSLHLAIELPVIKALLSGDANILAANNDGLLPIHLAVIRENSEMINYLFQKFYAATCLPLHTFIGRPHLDLHFQQ